MPPKPAKKPASTAAKKPASTAAKKPAASTSAAKKPNAGDKPISSAVVYLFAKCSQGTVLLIGKESYEKWGTPGGYMEKGEKPEEAAAREFQEETGYPLPKIVKEHSFRYRNTLIRLIYTDVCVEAKIGPKAKKPKEMLELKHILVKDLYGLLSKPDPKMPLRSVFISTLVDNRKEVESFLKAL